MADKREEEIWEQSFNRKDYPLLSFLFPFLFPVILCNALTRCAQKGREGRLGHEVSTHRDSEENADERER